MNFLKAMCVNYQRLLRRLDKKLSDKENKPFCQACWTNLNTTMKHHRRNETLPTHINLGDGQQIVHEPEALTASRPLIQSRPVISEPSKNLKTKRAK